MFRTCRVMCLQDWGLPIVPGSLPAGSWMPSPASPTSPKISISCGASIGCLVGFVPSGLLAELITASLPRAIHCKRAACPEACSTALRTCGVSSKVLEVGRTLWRPESRRARKEATIEPVADASAMRTTRSFPQDCCPTKCKSGLLDWAAQKAPDPDSTSTSLSPWCRNTSTKWQKTCSCLCKVYRLVEHVMRAPSTTAYNSDWPL